MQTAQIRSWKLLADGAGHTFLTATAPIDAEAVQTQRVIYWRCDFSEAFNESFLSDDAGFLLRYVSDAHLKFCLACSHGVPPGACASPYV